MSDPSQTPVAFGRTNLLHLHKTSRRAISRNPLTISAATEIANFPDAPTFKGDATKNSIEAGDTNGSGSKGGENWISSLISPSSKSLGAKLR